MNHEGSTARSQAINGFPSCRGPNFMYFMEKIVSSELKTTKIMAMEEIVIFCANFTKIL